MSDRPFSWMNPKLEIKDNNFGKGIYAKNDIKKHEILIVMGGYILTLDDDKRMKELALDYEFDLSPYFSISFINYNQKKLMPQSYINHSCNPNAGIKGQLFIVAMRKIRSLEEVLYDYAMVMCRNQKKSPLYKMDCLCGSKICRKLITDDDWKIPDLQKKYAGYFQWYIQEKINDMGKNKNKK